MVGDNCSSQKYICCQAPLYSTFADFWRMVYDFDVPCIFMLTDLIEKNIIKADRYWPSAGEKCIRYGRIWVKLKQVQKMDNYFVRNFVIWKDEEYDSEYSTSSSDSVVGISSNEESSLESSTCEAVSLSSGESSEESSIEEPENCKYVIQVHCKMWPDLGIPESTELMKNLMNELDLRKQDTSRPIVTHCSAGIGRTGTFVTAHIAVQRWLQGKSVSVKDVLMKLRNQRMGLIQSREQYYFVFKVVADIMKQKLGLIDPLQKNKLLNLNLGNVTPNRRRAISANRELIKPNRNNKENSEKPNHGRANNRRRRMRRFTYQPTRFIRKEKYFDNSSEEKDDENSA
eukprot:TRINITY_DN5005_c0_g2_i2.p1 TRINITY_DN5005_c0_g2~~TRINITY_DN5005_c0_g2_i2.p1  ORF type:complete len:343 (-),score=61.61 TRINITY_DN5005_c0_g2_i2:55-1083(-)